MEDRKGCRPPLRKRFAVDALGILRVPADRNLPPCGLVLAPPPNAVIRTVLLALLFSRQCSDAILSPDCSRLLFVCPAFSHQDGRQAHSSTEQKVGVLS